MTASIHVLACYEHWRALPPSLRRRIQETWRRRQEAPGDEQAIDAHEQAKGAAGYEWRAQSAAADEAEPFGNDWLYGDDPGVSTT